MTQDKNSKDMPSQLRSQAEAALSPNARDARPISALSPEDIQKLVHELQVYQIELEMQNEELRQTQLALEASRDNFSELYDFAPVGYVTLNGKGLILEANLTAARLLGVERQKLAKMFFSRFVCKEFGDTFYLHLQRVFTSQSRQTCEIKLTRTDATNLHVHLESVAAEDGSCKINQCRTIIVDITERKQVEDAFRRNTEKLNLVVEASTDGFWDWDLVTGNVWRSEGWRRILGYRLDETQPDVPAWDKLVHPDDLPRVMKAVEDHLAGLTSGYTNEYRILTKSGDWTWIRDRGRIAERDECGKPVRVTGAFHDITLQKRVEEALQESEEKYRLIFSKERDAIVLVDSETLKFIDANDAAAELWGYTRAELLCMTALDVGAEPELSGTSIILSGESSGDHVALGWHRKKDATVIPVEISAGLLTWKGRRIVCAIGRDISERLKAEELARQSARLRAVADLSSGVAHHFNNLLQIVIGSASLSLMDIESGEFSELKACLEKMLNAAKDGGEMVKRLQTFADMRAEITERECVIFDVASTARNAAEASKPLWMGETEKAGIKIDLQIDLEDGCLVTGQENEMFEVVLNLLRNAAEALPQGGVIAVKALKAADDVVITVRDTGIGITEKDLQRVFQPFWSTKGAAIGKGMGLAVSYGLVKRHGGTISVQSKAGVGTTFTIRLPLASEPVAETEKPASKPAEGPLAILVIDDESFVGELIQKICAKAGHRVFRALSGEEALALFNKEPVDLVLCDLGMPGMSGWEVGKAIGSICQERGITKPPFILLTGWGGQELEGKKIAESATDLVVAKPISPAALLAIVREIAGRFNIRPRVT
jgi:PAS domain S-box-containing protein